MVKLLRKRSLKAGLPPGTLVYIGDKKPEKVTISAIDYDAENYHENRNITLDECIQLLTNPHTVTWVSVNGIHEEETVRQLGQALKLHPLLQEDILNTDQQSKLDDYGDTLFIVMRMLRLDSVTGEVSDEQVSIVLGKNFVLSFLEGGRDIFDHIRERLRTGTGRIRKSGADYLCYSLMDAIVDHYFVILEHVDSELEKLEWDLAHNPKPKTLLKIHQSKRDVLLLRKSIWPTREVLSNCLRLETPLVSTSIRPYFHDIYDHTIQAIDTIESFRDISSGMLELYHSMISQKLNETMKVLTVVSTIFVPLTFIASVYGMNFHYMPELEWHYGYYTTLSIMGVVATGMLLFFRHKRWL